MLFQILCSPHLKNFTWITVNDVSELHYLADYYIIKGGIEINSVLYIGRAQMGNEVLVGKVFPFRHQYSGLKLFSSQGNEIELSAFELLVYPRY